MNRNFKRKSEEFQINLQDLGLNLNQMQAIPTNQEYASQDPRSIWLTNEIYPDTVAPIIQDIIDINYQDDLAEKKATLVGQSYVRHPIKLYISSYGGSVYDGLGLVGVIQRSKTPVHTFSFGKVMSMGFLLSVVASKRYTYPHTSYMVHSLSDVAYGKFASIAESVEEDARLQKKIDDLITSNTFIKQSQLNNVHSKKLDWYLDSERALTLGCVDEIL